jgi:hypothetical protein
MSPYYKEIVVHVCTVGYTLLLLATLQTKVLPKYIKLKLNYSYNQQFSALSKMVKIF